MADVKSSVYTAREAILDLLSDAEVAKVSTAESAAKLADGQEYVDLEDLQRGVQTASSASPVIMGQIVPREAVSGETWAKITLAVAH